MSDVKLVLGANQIDRNIDNANDHLREYRGNTGFDYLNYRSTLTLPNTLVPEDLAVTLLVNSRAKPTTFQSLQEFGSTIHLNVLPAKPLEKTTQEERHRIAELIAEVASWPGFAASTATKVLHKRRPDLIPVLDNQAIFGAYMNPDWPRQRASRDSVKSLELVERALNWITFDLLRAENTSAWSQLQVIEPSRSLIEIFDCVWWGYFRKIEPVK